MQKKVILTIAVLFVAILGLWFTNSAQQDQKPSAISFGGNQYERDYSVSIGPVNAKVTIVEFFDPACEACRAFYPFVKEILARHPEDVRLVLRYAAFHPGSDTVIRLLEVARQQNVFQTVLEALLINQAAWASHHQPDINQAWAIAETAGLDVVQAKRKIHDERFDQILKQENDDIRALKVSQTPTFFVNQKALEKFGAQELYQLVVAELNQSTI